MATRPPRRPDRAEPTTTSPGRTPLPSKLYYRIGEVAELVGVEPHVLRYWEREFRSIHPTKSTKGQRVYSRRDVESLLRVRELLYDEGFTIAGARKRLQSSARHDEGDGDGARDAGAAHREPAVAPAPTEESAADAGTRPDLGAAEGASQHARDALRSIRAEIEAFLADLGEPERHLR